MPNKAIMRAKQNRAASLGQSSRLYKMGNTGAFVPGGQGFGSKNPSIGSFKTLQYVEQVRTSDCRGGASVKELGACVADATLVYNAITDYTNPDGELFKLVDQFKLPKATSKESTNLVNSITELKDEVSIAINSADKLFKEIPNIDKEWKLVKMTLQKSGSATEDAEEITKAVENLKKIIDDTKTFKNTHLTQIGTQADIVNKKGEKVNTDINSIVEYVVNLQNASDKFKSFAKETLMGSNGDRITVTD